MSKTKWVITRSNPTLYLKSVDKNGLRLSFTSTDAITFTTAIDAGHFMRVLNYCFGHDNLTSIPITTNDRPT